MRSSAGLALEGLVGEHERDGAAWKTEWDFFPRACTATATALALGCELVAGLRVDEQRMRENVEAQQGYVLAEPVMLALAAHVGKQRAHELVHAAALRGRDEDISFRDALAAEPSIAEHLSSDQLDEAMRIERALGAVDVLIDRVLER